MHRALVLCQLALWISGAQAFLPFHLKPHADVDVIENRDAVARDAMGSMGFVTFKMSKTSSRRDEDISKKVSRIAQGLARKYGSELPARASHEDNILVDRTNSYSVVTPVKPTQSNSAGIYQDGTDFSYFIQAQLGSGATPMYMLVDTGASTTWVMSSACTSDPCSKHNTFGPDDSKSLKDTGKSFSVEYGSGDVSGHYVNDTIAVAGLSVPYEFGLANVTSSQFSSFPFDGILGLARNTGNFNDALKAAKVTSANIFAVSLARHSDGTNDGEITFGGTDPTKYTGDITYTSVTDDASWSIALDDVSVGGTSAGVKGRTAYIDTGTTYAFAPPADVKALYALIPSSESSDGITWTFPCDTTAQVALTFSGKTYSVSAKDFIGSAGSNNKCTGNIFGMEVVAGAWLLGDMFLKNVYSVFDIDGKRIGFASKPATTVTTTATSPSSTIVSTMTSKNGATTLTTLTSSTIATGVPSMGFTGGHDTSSVAAADPTATAETATATSSTGPASGADQSQAQGIYVSISCIISIIALVI